MTAMAPEAPPAAVRPSPGQSGGNPLKRKIGPLPTWAWVLVLLALILGVAYWKNRGAAGSGSSTATDTGETTDASQVPQFVNQSFTTVSPPTAPNPVPGPTPGLAGVGTKTLTVGRPMTLRQFAKEHHWTATTLAAVEQLNHLHPGSKLKKGQKIKRPWAPLQPGQTPLPQSAITPGAA